MEKFYENIRKGNEYLKRASFSPEREGYNKIQEVFDAIDKMCTEPLADMGDCRNRRWWKSGTGDLAERYTRIATSDDGNRWPRAESNERAFFIPDQEI